MPDSHTGNIICYSWHRQTFEENWKMQKTRIQKHRSYSKENRGYSVKRREFKTVLFSVVRYTKKRILYITQRTSCYKKRNKRDQERYLEVKYMNSEIKIQKRGLDNRKTWLKVELGFWNTKLRKSRKKYERLKNMRSKLRDSKRLIQKVQYPSKKKFKERRIEKMKRKKQLIKS